MTETVQHETLSKDDQDTSLAIVKALRDLDLATLSFVQLQRLKAAINATLVATETESARRTAEDNSGDTVQIVAQQKTD